MAMSVFTMPGSIRTTITVRDETIADIAPRERLLDAAFGPARFLKTCERLREGRLPAFGLAAVDADGQVVGTVRLWHVAAGPGRRALMLGPLAVDQSVRAQGVGSAMMRTALTRAAMDGHGAVLLVGDAPYYERFGFSASHTQGLWMPGPVERERFLGLELREGTLAGAWGFVSPTGDLRPTADLATLLAAAQPGAAFGVARAA
jgi:predicted N-acetyltransferase YhbS